LETRLTPTSISLTLSDPTTLVPLSNNTIVEGNQFIATATVVDDLGTRVGVGQLQFFFGNTTQTERLEGSGGLLSSAPFSTAGWAGPHTAAAAYTQGELIQDSVVDVPVNVLEVTDAQPLAPAVVAPGQSVLLQGNAVPHYANDPFPAGGSMTYFIDGQSVGTAQVSPGGQSQLRWTAPPVPGVHLFQVQYNGFTAVADGQTTSEPSALSLPIPLIVGQNTAAATLSSSANPATPGQPVTFTATVTGSGAAAPTGTVIVVIDGKVAATVPLNGSTASYTTSALTLGTHQVSAVYNGDANYAPEASANTLTEQVLAPATVLLAAPTTPVPAGQSIQLTATVSGQGTTGGQTISPTGTVTFSEGTASLGTVNLGGGQASLTVLPPLPGVHDFSVTYNTDGFFQTTSSAVAAVTVQRGVSQTTLAVSPAAPGLGQPVTLTATVRGSFHVGVDGAALPAGTVTFFDGLLPLATVPVDFLHNPVSFPTAGLSAGTHDFTAVYNGNTSFAGSTSGDVTVSVPPPPVAVPPPPVLDPPPPQVVGLVGVLVVRRRHGGLQQTLLVFNPSGQLITGPFYLVLDGLPKGVQWKNASGKVAKGHAHAGSPYLLLSPAQLNAGQSLTVDLSFAVSNGAAVHFSPVVLVGPGLV
jgi:hypothetical protein